MARWIHNKAKVKPQLPKLVQLFKQLIPLVKKAHETQVMKQKEEIEKLIQLRQLKAKNG